MAKYRAIILGLAGLWASAAVALAPPEDGAISQPTGTPTSEAVTDGEIAEEPSAIGPTRVLSATGVARLETVQGITLQWISWDERGKVSANPDEDGLWYLSGAQYDQSGAGVQVAGFITEIGEDYFVLDGKITIGDTPDVGRQCELDKQWRFAVTQNRTYFRLREFEWCDRLTDYIDIYFAPSLR